MKKKNLKKNCATENKFESMFINVSRKELFNLMTIVEESFDSGNLNNVLKQMEIIANSGNAEASYLLSNIYRDGEICEKSNEKFKNYLNLAAAQGNVNAQVDLAAILFRNEDDTIEKALALFGWIHEAALQGHPEAEMILSSFYGTGYGCEKNIKLSKIWGIKARIDKFDYDYAMAIMGYDDEDQE